VQVARPKPSKEGAKKQTPRHVQDRASMGDWHYPVRARRPLYPLQAGIARFDSGGSVYMVQDSGVLEEPNRLREAELDPRVEQHAL
jgi:hypothetical protein